MNEPGDEANVLATDHHQHLTITSQYIITSSLQLYHCITITSLHHHYIITSLNISLPLHHYIIITSLNISSLHHHYIITSLNISLPLHHHYIITSLNISLSLHHHYIITSLNISLSLHHHYITVTSPANDCVLMRVWQCCSLTSYTLTQQSLVSRTGLSEVAQSASSTGEG